MLRVAVAAVFISAAAVAAGTLPPAHIPAGAPLSGATAVAVTHDGSGMVVIRPVSKENVTDVATSKRTQIIADIRLPEGSFHAALPAKDLCASAPTPAPSPSEVPPALTPVSPSESPAATAPSEAPAAISPSPSEAPPAASAPPSTTPQTATVPNIKVAPDGKRYKCCDNVDCSPGSPGWAGDCDKQIDCRFIVCPPFEVAFPVVPPAEPVCKTWVPEEEVCKCSCRCVCMYSPSGKVYWVPGEPPRVDPSKLMSLDEAAAKGM